MLNTYSYVYQDPINNGDPSGLICGTGVCIVTAYVLLEIGLSVWDALETYDTVADECTSISEKGLALGVLAPDNFAIATIG